MINIQQPYLINLGMILSSLFLYWANGDILSKVTYPLQWHIVKNGTLLWVMYCNGLEIELVNKFYYCYYLHKHKARCRILARVKARWDYNRKHSVVICKGFWCCDMLSLAIFCQRLNNFRSNKVKTYIFEWLTLSFFPLLSDWPNFKCSW